MATSQDAARERKGEEEREKGEEKEKKEERGSDEGEGATKAEHESSKEEREENGGGSRGKGGGYGVAGDRQYLRPWDTPDPGRQRQLADRLSDPNQRSSRPNSRAQPRPDNAYDRDKRFNPAASSLLTIQQSPYTRTRPRTVAGTRMSSGFDSPRKDGEGGEGYHSPRRQPASARQSYNSRLASTNTYSSSASSTSPRRQPPLFPNQTNARRFTDEELDVFVNRVTRPTVASRGGVDLEDKDFTYIQPKRLKTLPVVPGLERRYLGLQPMPADRMDEVVERLTRLTYAYRAKFAPNRNVWVDREPGAHMVPQRGSSAQSAF